MSLKTLINIASMPGMDLAVTAAVELGTAVKNVKVYRTQCRDLSDRCAKLLEAFREHCQGLEGSEFAAAADEISCVIERARRKALLWASWNRIKSLVNQGDIKLGLEQLYKDIDSCAQHFNIASSAELHRSQRELQLIHERDVADNREILRNILQSVDGLRDILSDPNAVRPIMQTIQEQLQEESTQPDQLRELQQGLYEIHRKTQYLPPIVDLTGQIQRTSKAPTAYGAYNDVYTGLWLGEEKVALKFARAINHTEKARKRFHKEVEIWRDLQHRHICRLYGTFYEEDQIYSVSPWMECGSALDYMSSTDEVINRIVLLGDVASGMEYLHGRGVIHGDLRAANILIGDDGRACVSDFGLSRVIEEVAPDMSSVTHGDRPIRWQAPELVLPDDYDGPTSVSPATDVWSFGMLCLEILTGRKPYFYRIHDASVITDLVAHRLPSRPTDETVIRRGLDDRMWNLMLQVWNWDPVARPSMAAVRASVRYVQAPPASPLPMLMNSLSESPRQIATDLPQVTSQTAAIPVPKCTSLSPGVGPSYRFTPPSPSPLSSTPPKQLTPPRSTVLSSSPPHPAIKQYTSSLGYQIRNRLSTSSTPGQSSEFATNSSSPMPEITSGGYESASNVPLTPSAMPRTIASNTLARQPNSSRDGVHTASSSTTGSSGTPPSNLTLTNPTRRPASVQLKTPPHERTFSSSSGTSVSSPSVPSDSPNATRFQRSMSAPGPSLSSSSYTHRRPTNPPKVNVEPSDDDAIFAPLADTFGSIALIPEGDEDHLSSRLAATLQFPAHSTEERTESEPSGGSMSSSVPSSVDSRFTRVRSSSSSEVAPPRRQLLDFSGLNLSIYVSRKSNGSIAAASLAGLIDELLKGASTVDGYTRNQDFFCVFLTTHRLFASTLDVLRLLLYRFVAADSDRTIHAEERANIKFRVLVILDEWLKGHYAKALELQQLDDLRSFLLDIVSPMPFVKAAHDIIKKIDRLVTTRPSRAASPTLSHTGSRRSVRHSDITCTGLAIALSVLEGKKYRAITPTDCVTYLLHKNDAPGSVALNKVAEARVTNNKIVYWVKKSILRSDRPESRQDTLKFFIDTASECLELQSFSSVSALLAGIDSPQLTRLKLTRGRLDRPSRDTLKKLSGLLEISHNHRAYREALPDPKNVSCVPLLAVHLKDLQIAYERHPNRVQLGEQSLINFEKFVHVYESILHLLAFQEHEIRDFNSDVERKAGPLLYLEEQLATITTGRAAENRLEERSLELQKLEDRDYENRVPELAAVGFKTTRGR